MHSLIHPSVPNIGGIPLSLKVEDGLACLVRATTSDPRDVAAFTSAHLGWPDGDNSPHFGGRVPAGAVIQGVIYGVRLYGIGPQVDLRERTAVYYDPVQRTLKLRSGGGILAGYVVDSTYRIEGVQDGFSRAQVIEGHAGERTPVYLRHRYEVPAVGDVRLVVNHHHEPREVQDSDYTENKVYTVQPGGVQQFQCSGHAPPDGRARWKRVKGLPARVATVHVDISFLRTLAEG